MSKTATRRVNIFLNGKEVKGTIGDIRKEWRKLNNEVNKGKLTNEEYQKKAARIKELDGMMKAHKRNISSTGKAWQKTTGYLNNFIGIAATAFSVQAIAGYGKELFNTGVQLDNLSRKSLVVFGDKMAIVDEQAKEHAKTIGLSEAGYKGLATSIADTIKPFGASSEQAAHLSTEIINLAGAQAEYSGGKVTTAEASVIIKKALLGERESLEKLDIKVSEAMVTERLRAKGLENLTGKSLQLAKGTSTLELIMEQSGDAMKTFADNAGSLSRRKSELIAKITETKDKIAIALIPVFQNLVQLASDLADGLTWLGSALGSAESKAKDAGDAFGDQLTEVRNLEKQLPGLVSKYEDLQKNAGDNTAKQAELKKVIQQLGELVPTAVTEWDAYGKALGFNTEKAKEFVETQKAILAVKNEDQIQKQELALIELTKRQEGLNKSIKDGKSVFEEWAGFDKLSAEEIVEFKKEEAAIRATIAAKKAYINQLKGQDLDALVKNDTSEEDEAEAARKKAAEEARLKAESDANAAAKEREKRRKKAAKEAAAAAKRKEKELQGQLKRTQQIIEKSNNDIYLNNLDKDEKELEQIRQKYDTQIALAKERIQSGNEEVAEESRMQILELEDLKNEELENKKEEHRIAAEEKRKEWNEQIAIELADEKERQFLELDQHYQALLDQADQFGYNTEAIRQKWRDAEQALKDKFEEEKNAKQAKQDKKELAAEKKLAAAKLKVQEHRLKSYKEIGKNLKDLAGENELLQKGIFLFEKAQAIAQVIVNLQKEKAAIRAVGALLGPPIGEAYIAGKTLRANIRAGVSIGVIGATAIQGVSQKKEGGWHRVRGKDDNTTYTAKYIGSPSSGMLPNHPVVLASEVGAEYFVSNRDLQDPAIANYVGMIDNITKTRQFVNGGFTKENNVSTDDTIPAPPPSNNNLELINAINTLNAILASGVYAIIPDETVVGLPKRFNELNEASGGVLDS